MKDTAVAAFLSREGLGFRVWGPIQLKADLRVSLNSKPSILSPKEHMGGCQNYDPFWGTLNIRCRIIIGIQKGTIILTTTHMNVGTQNPNRHNPSKQAAKNTLNPEALHGQRVTTTQAQLKRVKPL